MSIADELRKLQELHNTGALTDAEFAKAKAEILEGGSHVQSPAGEVRPLFPLDPYDSLTPGRLRTMQIIASSLVTGVVVFVGIALYMVLVLNNGHGKAPPRDLPMVSFVAVAMLAICAPLAFLIPRLQTRLALRRILRGTWTVIPGFPPTMFATGGAKLMAVCQTEMFVGLALLQGAAFLGCVAYITEAQTLILGVPAAALVLMAFKFPTEGRVRAWYERQTDRLNELRQQAESAENQ